MNIHFYKTQTSTEQAIHSKNHSLHFILPTVLFVLCSIPLLSYHYSSLSVNTLRVWTSGWTLELRPVKYSQNRCKLQQVLLADIWWIKVYADHHRSLNVRARLVRADIFITEGGEGTVGVTYCLWFLCVFGMNTTERTHWECVCGGGQLKDALRHFSAESWSCSNISQGKTMEEMTTKMNTDVYITVYRFYILDNYPCIESIKLLNWCNLIALVRKNSYVQSRDFWIKTSSLELVFEIAHKTQFETEGKCFVVLKWFRNKNM